MHFVFACADVPSGVDATTGLADRAVPCWASKWLENAFLQAALEAALESVPHHGDHVFACGVPRHEPSRRPQLGIRFPALPVVSKTTALVRWLRCPPAPGAV